MTFYTSKDVGVLLCKQLWPNESLLSCINMLLASTATILLLLKLKYQ